MRILTIKLKNINSLRGEFELDFTKPPLKDAGLFAMIGKMGSGKSTILDCITLALFNAIPRYTKVSKDAIEKGGLILTKNERDCYAEVKYRCKSGDYTSKWSIGKTRNDTLRDYEMQVYDEIGIPLTDKKTEVPLKNAELIGLNYDQFSKSILLSQGEFAKFLRSSKNERAQLLEEITATKDFRRLGRMAYIVYGKKKKEIDAKLELIKSLTETLLLEEETQSLKVQIAEIEDAVGNAKTQRDLLKSRIELRRRIIQLQNEIGEKERKVAKSNQLLEDFDKEHAKAQRYYIELLPFKEKINEYVSKEEELVKHTKDLKDFETGDERLETRVGELVKEVSGWVKKEISAENFFDELEAFKENISAKTTRYRQYLREMSTAIVRINTALQPATFSEEHSMFHVVGSNDKLIQKLRSRLEDGEFLFKKHMEGHGLAEDQLGPTRLHLQESIRDLGMMQTDVRIFIQNLGRIRDNAAKQATIQSSLTNISLRAEALTAEQEILEALFTKAEEERKRMLTEQTLDAYRNQLVEGEPCPLCGSESHPYVHEYAKDLSKIDDQYNKAKQSLGEKRKELQNALQQKSSTEAQLMSVGELIARDEADNARAKERIDAIKKKLGIDNKIGSVEAVDGFIIEYKEKLAAVEFCLDHLSSKPTIGNLLEELVSYDQSQCESDKLKKEIEEEYSGEDIQSDYKQRRDAMQSAIDQRKEIQSAIVNSRNAIQSLQSIIAAISDEITPQLSSLGHPSIKDAKEKIISESVFHQLTKRRGALDNELQLAKKLLSEDIHRLTIESTNDDPAITIESLLQEQKAKDVEFEALNKELEDAKVKFRMDEETRKEIAHIEATIQDQKKANLPWELLCRFIGDKTGNTFNNFAQELTLKHLLNFANRRLQKLHSRYILSMPLDVEDDDLVVVDTNMGNERRSVKTLSGGETFIISLSLALGLSDLASRDVLIESLFIDEGFGTLDPEVLETTIGTLEQLQAESNKTVGIISHVDSMRERIYTQVQLEKQQNGFSTMKIYPETS